MVEVLVVVVKMVMVVQETLPLQVHLKEIMVVMVLHLRQQKVVVEVVVLVALAEMVQGALVVLVEMEQQTILQEVQ